MRTKQLYKTVEINVMEIDGPDAALHKHHFFQLVYVIKGHGVHTINDNNFEFSKGDVFLLAPGDEHSFTIVTPPTFCLIDFTREFFSKNSHKNNDEMDLSNSFKRLEYIFHSQNILKGNLASSTNRQMLDVLINQLIEEKENELPFGKIMTQNIIFLLLNMIARNIQQRIISSSKKENPKNKIYEIITYIQNNIYDKEQLSIENIASHFNMSEGHLSRYFKLQSESTIKEYIIRYKLEIAMARLKYSDLTMSEIAIELNFTDQSHLNKAFKNAIGKTAKQFKKDHFDSKSADKKTEL